MVIYDDGELNCLKTGYAGLYFGGICFLPQMFEKKNMIHLQMELSSWEHHI